jgi:hypothetical protein
VKPARRASSEGTRFVRRTECVRAAGPTWVTGSHISHNAPRRVTRVALHSRPMRKLIDHLREEEEGDEVRP